MNNYTDTDWSSEVRYPDMPMQQQTAMTTMPAAQQAAPPVARSASPFAASETPRYHISYEELRGADFPNGAVRSPLDLENPVPQEVMGNPTSNQDVYQASMKSLLARNLGYYVVATFQLGTQGTVSVPGILYTVGNDYIVIYQPEKNRYVTGDLYALKFLEFHDTKSIPRRPVPAIPETAEVIAGN